MLDDSDWMPAGDWRGYEAYVLGSLARRFPAVRLEANVRLPGKKSGVARQIDVLAHADQPVAVECKFVGRKVDVKCVEAFIGMLEDVGIGRGIIITAAGFTPGAQRRAFHDQRIVELETVHPDRLSPHQHRGAPIIWRAPLGISLDLPDGWTCDTELTAVPGGAAMIMYPLGHDRLSAMHVAPVIYGNFLTKHRGDETLDELAAPHQQDLMLGHPEYSFDVDRLTLADRSGAMRAALIRRASGPPPIFGEEHALYIDYGEVALLLVLCAPPGESELLRPRLIGLYEDSFTMTVVDRRSE